MIQVWDPVVRIFHWGLAACFALAWLTADEVPLAHEWLGYSAAALVAVRVVWGFAGSRHARFSQFVRGPRAVMAYLRSMVAGRERRYIGHNPAGAAMVVALLLSMAGTAVTGWLMAEPGRQVLLSGLATPALADPAFADDDGDGARGGDRGDGAVEDLHEALANLMLFLVVLHLGGVALASLRHHENLPRAMMTGLKRPAETGDID